MISNDERAQALDRAQRAAGFLATVDAEATAEPVAMHLDMIQTLRDARNVWDSVAALEWMVTERRSGTVPGVRVERGARGVSTVRRDGAEIGTVADHARGGFAAWDLTSNLVGHYRTEAGAVAAVLANSDRADVAHPFKVGGAA